MIWYLGLWMQGMVAFADEPSVDQQKEAAAEPSEVTPVQHEQKDEQPIAVRLVLVNGLQLVGTIPMHELLSWSPGTAVNFTPEGGARSLIAGDRITKVEQLAANKTSPVTAEPNATSQTTPTGTAPQAYTSPRGFQYINPAASRYLYAPSSISLQKGQGYVSQKLLFTSFRVPNSTRNS